MSAVRTNRRGRMYRPGGAASSLEGRRYYIEEGAREAAEAANLESSKGLVFDGWNPIGASVRTAHGENARLSPYLRELKKKNKEE